MKNLLLALSFLLAACASQSPPVSQLGKAAPLQSQQLYVVPFETIMVPAEVADNLFNAFVDRLNAQGARYGYEFIILKQGLEQIDLEWLSQRDYLRGELYAYVEDVGSSVTDIKARSRLRLYQPGQGSASLQLNYPVEVFYENDYSSLAAERRKLVEKISRQLADRLLQVLSRQEVPGSGAR